MNVKLKRVLFVIVLFSIFVGCSRKGSNLEDSADSRDSVLRLASSFDAGRLTPFQHTPRGPGIFKLNLIYDSLLEKGVNGDIPWLAESWDISNDKKTITFKLRNNVKWHDGIAFSAEDVKFTFDYFKDNPPVRHSLIDNGKYIIKGVSVIDGLTVSIELIKGNSTYLSAVGVTRIIPKHIWENVDDPNKFTGEGCNIGCGPYMLTDYNSEQGSYKYQAFKDYWGKKQVAQVLEYISVSNPVLAFENNEIDITAISPDMVSRFSNSKTCKMINYHTQHCYRLYFNMDKIQEFKDKHVRQAVAYAIDRNSLIEKVHRGYGEIMPMGYIYAGHPYYNPNIKKYDHNVEKAKELMKNMKISVTLNVMNNPESIKISELIKADLNKIGIDINVVSSDRKTHDSLVKKGNFEFALIYYGGLGGDPNMLKKFFYTYDGSRSGGTVIGYSNKELDEVLNAQSVEENIERRKELVGKAQAIIAEDVPMVLLYSDKQIVVYNPTKNDNWTSVYDHSRVYHPKLSFLK